jgi:DNA primase
VERRRAVGRSARRPLRHVEQGVDAGTLTIGTRASHAVDVTVDEPQPGCEPGVLRDVTTAAAEILASRPRRAGALAYLRQRGIDTTALPDSWPLGYAPPRWTRLCDMLRTRFADQVLLDTGLARPSSGGGLIDSFRDRVVFPVHDTSGHMAGFIGRDLSGHPETPKYLNSTSSAIFAKGQLLYGLHEGRTSNPAFRTPVLVEGPLDVLAITARARTAGRTDLLPIAASGTAFTSAHASLVAHAANDRTVVIALDGDAAGHAGALRAGELLRATGLDVRVSLLPNGIDPSDYLTGPDASLDPFTHDRAIPLLTVHVQQAIAAEGDRMQWIEGRLGAARSIAAKLTAYPVASTAREIGWIAHALQIDPRTLTYELVTAYRSAVDKGSPLGRPVHLEPDSIPA